MELESSKGKTGEARRRLRFVTASSLFDGHDASINMIRRLLQGAGAEVIHLGHNRSAAEIVTAAVQEDAAAIAVSSYQGGHVEFLSYMVDLLRQWDASHIRIFAGGGGVITAAEADELHRYGVAKIFTPEDGRTLGLEGMIDWMLRGADDEPPARSLEQELKLLKEGHPGALARLITSAEEGSAGIAGLLESLRQTGTAMVPVIGITGTGGAGKSSLTDELVRRYLRYDPSGKIAVISVDPTRQKTGGALLGDRIRMNAIGGSRTYMRSMATRGSGKELSDATAEAVELAKAAGFSWIIVETSGIGQGDSAIASLCDIAVYVMTSEYGAPSQLEKIDMLDYADIIVINKFDRAGSEDAWRDVSKQFIRSRGLTSVPDVVPPIYGTIASRFNDEGTNGLFAAIVEAVSRLTAKTATDVGASADSKQSASNAVDHADSKQLDSAAESSASGASGANNKRQPVAAGARKSAPSPIIPRERTGYLGEIVRTVRARHTFVREQSELARRIGQLKGTFEWAAERRTAAAPIATAESLPVVGGETAKEDATPLFADWLTDMIGELEQQMHPISKTLLEGWPALLASYRPSSAREDDAKISAAPYWVTLSGLPVPRIALPRYTCPGDLLQWLMTENVPGRPPYTAGVFPFKRRDEEPKRQFAGEGTPERTNLRFHYLSRHDEAKRLSVAFDSVTLYGMDPGRRPDIYGKIGNSGVSICTLDDMEKLFQGFDLCHPSTSVSMTINGPAPILLAMFMNAAIRQQMNRFLAEQGREPDAEEAERLRAWTLRTVRGTVQADILKEDQGQNTCIFSTEFALKMMGDVQRYFIDKGVRHYYSVSISGYHIAEAGANPISQLAFTLANGFTYVEYYLSRGMAIDDFAPNLSFFFSNGLDPEYAVLGRVARRIWSTVIKDLYKGNERSQKLKYHVQTSGRSLHAQEMDFNDIRTTLQALLAVYDNCNSLHTNAYDEAITTPTEHSVRRAMAVQLIIGQEFGLAKNENPLQGSFVIEELTDLVEEAVLAEFERIHLRGGVLGAMDTGYQRGRIQEESLLYERLKHNGELPIVGVNTFLNPDPSIVMSAEPELARSTREEKETQLTNLQTFQTVHQTDAEQALERLLHTALSGGNVFEELMETVRHASLGQMTAVLFEAGGQYRRNM
ncbi:methylmalonyl-CoA mutase family protein [Paenibacillus sp. strain BS8-2]